MFKEVEMRTAQDILENMEEEINRLRAELNNSKNFHCPHYLTNDSGGVSCHRDFEKEIASLKELVVQAILLIETDKSDYSLKNVWVYNKHEWLKKVEHYIKIKISLEAPEKTRTISESEFDKIYMDAFGTNSSSTYINLKKELFP